MNHLVSINIITHNRGRYIKEAVESVINQSFKNWELIIVDDRSTDDTEAIISDYAKKDDRVRYFKLPKRGGISKARNFALRESAGKFIAVLDSDDVWADRDKLKKQYEFLEKNKDYVLVGGGVIVIDENGKEIKKYFNSENDEDIRGKILYKNQFAHSGVMFVRDAALKAGGYDESLNIGEDYDMWLKLGTIGKMYNFQEYFLKYRVHQSNVTLNRIEALKNNLAIIKKYGSKYPNYCLAYLRRLIRMAVYKVLYHS